MNTTVAVFTRELRQNSRIFLVAAALLLVPIIAAIVPSVSGRRGDAAATVGGGAAIVYGLAVAVTLGVSLIGRELAEKRLSFYFSKPVSPGAVWAGKGLSALVTIFGAMLIIAVPTMLFSPLTWAPPIRDLAAMIAFLAVASFLVSHTIVTMVRSRSGLIAIDLLCVLAIGFVTYLLLRQLFAGGALDTAKAMIKAGAWSVLAVLAVAPVWQLAHGRTDVRRNHAALSTFVWSALAIVIAVGAVYVGWVVTAPLSSIVQYGSIEQTPKGDWALVSGETSRAGYFTSYLVNTRTGEKTRNRVAPWRGDVISRDGSTLVTTELAALFPNRGLVDLRVGPFGNRDKTTVIHVPEWLVQSTLSDDGSRLAVATNTAISAYETGNGRMTMAVRFDRGSKVMRMYFASPSIVRIHSRNNPGSETIHELDLEKRSLVQTGTLATKHSWNSVSEDGSRLYLRDQSAIVDARTGALIAALPVKPVFFLSGAMMNDGRVVVIAKDGLHLFDRDGRELKTISLPQLDKISIRGQVGHSKLIVSAGTTTMVVDLERNTFTPLLKNVRGPMSSWTEPRLVRFAEDATIIGIDEQSKLLLWDAHTREKRSFPM